MAMLFDLGKIPEAVVAAIKSGISAGETGASILKTLQDSGAGLRSQTFYSAFNYIQGQLLGPERYVQSLKPSSKPIIGLLPKSLTSQLRNLSYRVSFNQSMTNDKGQPTEFITISTNELLTPQEAIDAAMPFAQKYSDNLDPEGLEGTVTQITLNNGTLYESNSFDAATVAFLNAQNAE